MDAFLATGVAALMDVLVLLGIAFVLSRGFVLLQRRRQRWRTAILGVAFGAMAVGSMMASFSIGPGSIGDFRNAVVAVAAIVGGPVPALVAAAAAAAYRAHLGGQYAMAIVGIAAAAVLSIGFTRTKLPKTPVNLALFGLLLAVATALLPLVASLLSLEPAARFGGAGFVFAVVIYPITIVVVGGLLRSEQRRAAEEAELKTLNATLSLEAARLQGVFEGSGVAMAWADLTTGRFIRVNPQYVNFTGYSEVELIGKRYDELAPPEDREKDFAVIKPLQTGERMFVNDEKRYLRKDGTVAWGLRSLTAVHEGGEPRYAFAILQDITERRRAREEIAYLASHDSLTGLINRLVFHSEFEEAVARRRSDELVAVLYVDLDNFKEINDTLGHPAGDAILIEVARRLRGCVEKEDIVARFGGDEFALLRGTAATAGEIRELAELVIDRVREPYTVGTDVAHLEVSVGISQGPRDIATLPYWNFSRRRGAGRSLRIVTKTRRSVATGRSSR